METQASDIHEESPSNSAAIQLAEHREGLRKTGWIFLLVLVVGIFMLSSSTCCCSWSLLLLR